MIPLIFKMRKESFNAAENLIKLAFSQEQAYTARDVMNIFEQNKEVWNIAAYRNYKHLIKFLDDKKILTLIKLKQVKTGAIKQILAKPQASKFNIAQTIKKEGHLSNYTAMQIHQLTLQVPKSIYVSYDKYPDRHYDTSINRQDLTQEAIDKAFEKPQRVTSEVYRNEADNTRYFYIQKKNDPKHTGILEESGLFYTDLERTLIDIAIRPGYSGGVLEVLQAFINAKPRVDVNKLKLYLDELDYIYPYYQLIGFYLDKANYNSNQLIPFLNERTELNFYLTYSMSNKVFDTKWRIYYPKGL